MEKDLVVNENEFDLDFEEEPRKSPLARRIQEEYNGDVISAIHFMLEENEVEDAKILFSLLADEAFEVLSDDDYVALCENVLNDLDAEFE